MNLFIAILKALRVQYTPDFANETFRQQPFRDSFFGLSKMLDLYGIDNVSINVTDRTQYELFDCPFITQMGRNFALIQDYNGRSVKCVINGKSQILSLENFISRSSNKVLAFEKNDFSGEPGYFKNLIGYLMRLFFLFAFVLCALFLLLAAIYDAYTIGKIYLSFVIALFFDLVGLVTSVILLRKEQKIKNKFVDKFCTLFKNANCDEFLGNANRKLLGKYSWSIVGIAYFCANFICLVAFGPDNPSVLFVNALSIIFSIWSVLYQWKIARQFCPLCLLVCFSCWCIVLPVYSTLVNDSIVRHYDSLDILCALSSYGLIFIGGVYVLSLFTKKGHLEIENLKIQTFKLKDSTLEAILRKQKPYDIDTFNSKIVVANPNGKIRITVLTNPHCLPCSRMHARLEKVSRINKDLRIEYIFSSFTESLEDSAYCLIYNFLHSPNPNQMLTDWFVSGKDNRQDFYMKYPFNRNDAETMAEMQAHDRWKSQSNLSATPTILINGKLKPEDYSVEDLEFITSL